MSSKPRYLSKSRFRMSLECPAKLYYTGKKEYNNLNDCDDFLRALAEGGNLIGEYAKFFFADDVDQITIKTAPWEYEASLKSTQQRLTAPGDVTIAEAAFLYNNCYVRADLLQRKNGVLFLYEVKAKSWSGDTPLADDDGKPCSAYESYLYDVAFQKWVIEKATGLKVYAHLMLVNKDICCDVHGLASHFRIVRNENGATSIETTPGLTQQQLGTNILKSINVDNACSWIYCNPVPGKLNQEFSFEDYVAFLVRHYEEDKKIYVTPGPHCKSCEFQASKSNGASGKSGLKECWIENGLVSEKDFQEDLVFDLWCGKAGNNNIIEKLFNQNKYLLKQAERSDFDPNLKDAADVLTSHHRREIQITKVRNKDRSPHIEREGLRDTIAAFVYPYHFIDFETSAMPLPFHIHRKPYEGIAFQFSHHVMYEDGLIEHIGQFLSFEPGVFPNYDFVRALKKELENDQGTIFRYHNHENTYLRLICEQLVNDEAVEDRESLIQFIDSITKYKIRQEDKDIPVAGVRNMVDLYDIVLKYYYSPHAKGSNSLKQILPAAIHDFPVLREKYGRPVYGRDREIPSLNYDEKVWITEQFNLDPYHSLEPVFYNIPAQELDRLVSGMDSVADGGTAMIAYSLLQYSKIPIDQRERIKAALLRYCELDTLAMVMLMEGLQQACGHAAS